MDTILHFNSANEMDLHIMNAIKLAYRDKPITVTIQDDTESVERNIPDWQKEETRKRIDEMKAHPEKVLTRKEFTDKIHGLLQ